MNTITMANIEGTIARLNKITGNPEASYTKHEDGKYTANIGNYYTDCAYGKVGINRMVSEGGGVTNIIPFGTKRETYNRLHSYLDGVLSKMEG